MTCICITVAAKDISYWRSKTIAAGAARSLDDRDELQLWVSDVRALLISKTAEAGFHREAQRLALQGAAGFPDESNLALIGDMLGGSVALSVGDTYLVKGTGPSSCTSSLLQQWTARDTNRDIFSSTRAICQSVLVTKPWLET